MTAGTGSLHLVFGASGYIGTNLVPRLLESGKRVRASARVEGVSPCTRSHASANAPISHGHTVP